MKNTLILLLKIIFLYFIILSNSFGQSHFGIGKFPKPINDCYEVIYYEKSMVKSYKKCDVIEYEYFYNYTPPLFIINDNVSVNQSWSELQSNSKCIYIKKRKDSSNLAFECNIDSERFVSYKFHYHGRGITFNSVEYLACSNNDVEKIRESLINKFKTENVNIYDEHPGSRHSFFSNKIKYILDLRDNTKPHSNIKLHAAIITGKELNSNLMFNGPEKNLKCPGDVMLMIELRADGFSGNIKSKLKEAIDKIDKEDELNKGSKTSTPKF